MSRTPRSRDDRQGDDDDDDDEVGLLYHYDLL